MAITKKKTITWRQVGRNLNVKIDEEKFTKTGDKETLTPIKEAINKYEEKPTASALKTLIALLKPKTTEIKVKKEKLEENLKATKKAISNKKRLVKKEKTISIEDAIKVIESGNLSEEELNRLREITKDVKVHQIPKQIPDIAKRGRRGEY